MILLYLVRDAINGELSACESDTDSLSSPNDTPLHRINALKSSDANNVTTLNSLQSSNVCPVGATRSTRSGSSFGLHSPDVYPNLVQAEHELIESLRQMQSEGEFNSQFSNDTIYLDPDIIDLTIIPPPDTPDNELIGSSIIMMPAEDPPTPYREDIDFSHFNVDSARVVAELDDLCDTLSEMRSSSDGTNLPLNELESMPPDIDDFIASMTVPPPPSTTRLAVNQPNGEEYLNAYIIPPPPSSSPSMTQAQDDVIARFWKVTDDIKKICNHEEISPRLFKREVHSSSSGESGYDSTLTSSSLSSCNSEWPVFHDGGSPKLSLPTVKEVVTLENNFPDQRSVYIKKSERSNSSDSINSNELHMKESEMIHVTNNPSMSRPSNLSRSHSWNNLPTNGIPLSPSSTTKYSKPPIPPCSPSIQERRRQLAIKSNVMNGSQSLKFHKMRNGNVINRQHHNGYHHHPIVENIMTAPLMNGCLSSDLQPNNGDDEIFIQSQRDIDILLARLEDVHENRLRNPSYSRVESDKFIAAKEALVTESRQFVTASKLFVKCATEASPQLLEHLIECVTLLERMYSVSEIVLVHLESQAQITCLVDRLKEVAATYAYTVDTVHKLSDTVCSPSTSPYMGLLMNHATSLATALSALMRTLRTINS